MNGFLVSDSARRQFDIEIEHINRLGSLYLENPSYAYVLEQKLNAEKETHLEQGGLEIFYASVLCDAWRHLIFVFNQHTGQKIEQRLESIYQQIGEVEFKKLSEQFRFAFPQGKVANIYADKNKYSFNLNQEVLVEPMVLWLANENPAMSFLKEIFNDQVLRQQYHLEEVVGILGKNFSGEGIFSGISLLDLLLEPIRKSPYSLLGQVDFLLERWGNYLGDFAVILYRAKDFWAEANKFRGFGPGPVSAPLPDVHLLGENFSHDRGWMLNLVLLAKNVYVWMSQISKQYGRPVNKLSEIPDEELAELARRGITGIWLIGLWQRSSASKTIKHWTGNHEAEASAYSLKSYRVADDIGGEAAFFDLKERMLKFGIRIGCDMVPNHMGIDSDWIYEHPDWFISLDQPPFPSYSFSGESLSTRPEADVFLEDHYFDKSDAAVVFKYVDRRQNTTKYIYHGNDGTSMPWNDTAQLNYLLPEVRQAVADVIMRVSRLCSIIRFDAAMTLTKKHFQRLWFPQPGSGGDIASRSWHGLSQAEFDLLMPGEFWKDVVDRIAAENPDTLLLAEAFWFTEEFFVRSLGMHRVYNSAFMHMLRDEDNAKYRASIKETIAFNSEILKRYTNFMNNPDEKTAIEQFGNGDKYFGVFTLMVTLPGLPMIGHGQFEGYHEKYGMEFRDAKWNEKADTNLVHRHLAEITPLLLNRDLFANVIHFRFFNFYEKGGVNENVYAFTNENAGKKILVLYNNNFQNAAGQIFTSEPAKIEANAHAFTETITDIMGISHLDDGFLLFQNQKTSFYHLLPIAKIKENGFFDNLNGYQAKVYWNFQILPDEHRYWDVYFQYQNSGFYNLEQAISSVIFHSFERTMKRIEGFNPLQFLYTQTEFGIHKNVIRDFKKEVISHNQSILAIYENFVVADDRNVEIIAHNFDVLCQVLLQKLAATTDFLRQLMTHCDKNIIFYILIMQNSDQQKYLLDFFRPHLENIIKTDSSVNMSIPALFFFMNFVYHYNLKKKGIVEFLKSVFEDTILRKILEKLTGKHSYEGISYFNKEKLEQVNNHLLLLILLMEQMGSYPQPAFDENELSQLTIDAAKVLELAESNGYQWHNFMIALQQYASGPLKHLRGSSS